jgi:hypothetical protein
VNAAGWKQLVAGMIILHRQPKLPELIGTLRPPRRLSRLLNCWN